MANVLCIIFTLGFIALLIIVGVLVFMIQDMDNRMAEMQIQLDNN